MGKSSEYLYRCLDIIKADVNLSEETRITMFIEYSKLVTEESKSSDWLFNKEHKPSKPSMYEVYRASTNKQHYEIWNGMIWANHNKEITHWRIIKAPRNFTNI